MNSQNNYRKAKNKRRFFEEIEPILGTLSSAVTYYLTSLVAIGSIAGIMFFISFARSEGIYHVGDSFIPFVTSFGIISVVVCTLIGFIIYLPIFSLNKYRGNAGRFRIVDRISMYFSSISLILLSISIKMNCNILISVVVPFIFSFLVLTLRNYFISDNFSKNHKIKIHFANFLSTSIEITPIIIFASVLNIIWFYLVSLTLKLPLSDSPDNIKIFSIWIKLDIIIYVITIIFHFILCYPWGFEWASPKVSNRQILVNFLIYSPVLVAAFFIFIGIVDGAKLSKEIMRNILIGGSDQPVYLILSADSFKQTPFELRELKNDDDGLLRTAPVCIVLEVGNQIYVRRAVRKGINWECISNTPIIALKSAQVIAYPSVQ